MGTNAKIRRRARAVYAEIVNDHQRQKRNIEIALERTLSALEVERFTAQRVVSPDIVVPDWEC